MKILIKRAVKHVYRKLRRDQHESLISINLSKSALLNNLDQFKKKNGGTDIAPVLKSNAYGHGLIEVARMLEGKVPCLVIDSYFEAEKLRSHGINSPLLVIGFVRPETINQSRLKNVYFTISSPEVLRSVKSFSKIHLKIDTGMHRQGIPLDKIDECLDYIKNNKIDLSGICSHLSDADNPDSSFTNEQIKVWNSIVESVLAKFPTLKYYHLSNTYGHKFSEKIKANLSRLGIGLYGLAELDGLDLKPVLNMNTIITNIREIKKGEKIGYNNTFAASSNMRIATIPVGYYEGLDRDLSNKGFLKIKEKFCPIIGRISMNITTIDVSEIKDIKIGDEVNVISSNKSDKNSILEMSKLTKRITYESVVKIPAHLKRVLVD